MTKNRGKNAQGRTTYPVGILEIGDKKYRVEEAVNYGSHGWKEMKLKLTDQATGDTIWGKYVEVSK